MEEDKNKSKNWGSIVFNMIAVICIILFCSAIAPKTLQNDTFYTISIGEYIYNNGISNLTEDIYSWHELPYTYPHWLYDLLIFLIYKPFGQLGIYISTMVFASILGISIYCLSTKKSKNKFVSFIVTLASIYLMKSFIAARAQLVTFILFTWTVFFIEKFLDTGKKRYAVFLIIIPLLITNLHCAVFPFYFVLFLPYIAEFFIITIVDLNLDIKVYKLFIRIKRKLSKKQEKKEAYTEKLEKLEKIKILNKEKRKKLREKPYKIIVKKNYKVILLIAIMAISFLTGYLNPAGNGAITYLYKTMKGNTMKSINEHLPLTLAENEHFAIALILFLLILIFTDTKIKLPDLFMIAGITFLAFKSRRQVSMFAILCGPILAALIGQMVDKYDKATFIKIEKFMSGWFGATVMVCCFIILSTRIIKPHLDDNYINTSSYPVDASNWIIEHLDLSKVKFYNEYNYGSYLLFRGIPVFIDSRCDLYTPEFNGKKDIFSDALNIANLSEKYENKFKEYGVTHVILYKNSNLVKFLEVDSNYKLLYNKKNENFKIFERLNANEK